LKPEHPTKRENMPKRTYKPIDPQVASLVQEHEANSEAVLEMLTELQSKRSNLTPAMIADVANALHISVERVFGIASFYSMLSIAEEEKSQNHIVRVCDGPVCWLCQGSSIHKTVQAALQDNPSWKVERTSCLGLCDQAPAVLVDQDQVGPVTPETAAHLAEDHRSQAIDYSQPRSGELRVMMAMAGKIDPDSLESALLHRAYQGLRAALDRSAEAVVKEVEDAGLTGRGGAGFPVGRKWRFVAQARPTPKYVICNADESEPLIFKDRILIDTNPHQILEGMAIAGYATGAQEGYIYIRGEYAPQADRLEHAIEQAETAGWLGENIQDSNFSFHIHVHRGAGAYICGEETALIESLEGKRGEPRNRPPYPPTAGYRNLPTLVNNVESYAAAPAILSNGAAWYRSLSSYPTPGTKMYMLLGHVNRPGLFEAAFGLTLRQVIEAFGGGMRPGSSFQFALTGGAAGTIVSAEFLDIPIDYASAAKGISLGAGAFLICDQRVSPVAFLKELLHFFVVESCGKCTPCRMGTHRALEILDRLAEKKGQPGDLEELLNLAEVMQVASFCGLGQSVIIPVKSAVDNFRQSFIEAISQS
jgi:NADH:ubiquinone oxidoreductase subunit F (NADH-binding)/NADH:ubiquinone oxidoreductase subunit E